jgi:outer membrane protein assembly factor BamB
VHAWIRGYAEGAWWGSARALWLALAFVALIATMLSYGRHRRAFRRGDLPTLPASRFTCVTFGVMSGFSLAMVLWAAGQGTLFRWPWREALPVALAVWGGSLLLLHEWRRRARAAGQTFHADGTAPRAAISRETGMLAALAVGLGIVALNAEPPPTPQVAWVFEAVDRGVVLSTPVVADDSVYVSAAHATGLKTFGAVYAVERKTGKQRWKFNRDGAMKQALSSPALASGRIFVGEGLHEDAECRMYCLDAATGRELWSHVTKSHVESTPCVADGYVYFGAGDDGVYCLSAAKGDLRWRFPGGHVDASPTVVGTRVLAGSCYRHAEMFCLDTASGQPVWRVPSDLSVFGAPTVAGDQVFFAVGNGKLNKSDARPAGAVVCLHVKTGARQWRYDVGDAVMGAPAVDKDSAYCGARDRHCYCLDRKDGSLRWKKDLGSPVVAAPVLAGTQLYAVASGGIVYCLDANDGALVWQVDLAKHLRASTEMMSAPSVLHEDADVRVYVGGGVHASINSAAVVFCFKQPAQK